MSGDLPLNINIKEPQWDQSTFMGRAQHFFTVTDPRNVLLPNEVLEDARVIVEDYRSTEGDNLHFTFGLLKPFLLYRGVNHFSQRVFIPIQQEPHLIPPV